MHYSINNYGNPYSLFSKEFILIKRGDQGSILENVFKARHPVLAMLMTCKDPFNYKLDTNTHFALVVLVFLSSIETVYNKSEWSFNGMVCIFIS